MAVIGFPAIGMSDDDHVAVGALPTGMNDPSISYGGNGRPGRCGVIETIMGPSDFENGMKTSLGETGADPPEIERRFQKGLSQQFPHFVIVIGFAVMIEAVGLETLAIIGKISGDNIAILFEFPVAKETFDNDAIGVALSQIRTKIDVPGEDIGKLQGQQ